MLDWEEVLSQVVLPWIRIPIDQTGTRCPRSVFDRRMYRYLDGVTINDMASKRYVKALCLTWQGEWMF